MHLSDEESRALKEIERFLTAENPDLAKQLRPAGILPEPGKTLQIVWKTLFVMIAFCVVLVGIVAEFTLLGALGFTLMIVAAGARHEVSPRLIVSSADLIPRRYP